MLSIPSPASSMEATGRSGKLLWMASLRGWVSIVVLPWSTARAELRACGPSGRRRPRVRHRSSAADKWDFTNARTCRMTSHVAGLSSATSKACGPVA